MAILFYLKCLIASLASFERFSTGPLKRRNRAMQINSMRWVSGQLDWFKSSEVWTGSSKVSSIQVILPSCSLSRIWMSWHHGSTKSAKPLSFWFILSFEPCPIHDLNLKSLSWGEFGDAWSDATMQGTRKNYGNMDIQTPLLPGTIQFSMFSWRRHKGIFNNNYNVFPFRSEENSWIGCLK